jgi:hypothetical protein
MTSSAAVTSSSRSLTLRDILKAPAQADLSQQLSQFKALDGAMLKIGVPDTTIWEGAYNSLGSVVNDLLGFDLCKAMEDAWRRHEDLIATAKQTIVDGSSASVPLGNRDITFTLTPSVDITYAAITETLEFPVTVDITKISICGVVDKGVLVALSSGTCTVSVKVDFLGKPFLEGSLPIQPVDLVDLGNGVALLAA